MSKSKYKDTFQHLAEKYEDELAELETADDSFGQDDDAIFPMAALNLATVPIEEWADLKVSSVSRFGDPDWDWRNEGSPLYKQTTIFRWDKEIADGVSLLAPCNDLLLKLVHALAFYSLPPNSCLRNTRSYNTSLSNCKAVVQLARFMYKHDIYVDRHGNGNYRTVDHLDSQYFLDFLETDIESPHVRLAIASEIRHWERLSAADLLPDVFQLRFSVISDELNGRLHRESQNASNPYLPISPDALSILVPHCVNILENSAEDILYAYEHFWPILAGRDVVKEENFCWERALEALLKRESELWDMEALARGKVTLGNKVAYEFKRKIAQHPDWLNHPNYVAGQALWHMPAYQVVELSNDLGIELVNFANQIRYDLLACFNHVIRLATELRNVCMVILFLVTGMRRSEMAHLEKGNCWKIPGTKDDFRLKFFVFKTSDSSQGDYTILPVPEIAFKAYQCLERLGEPARRREGTNHLLVGLHRGNFGKNTTRNGISAILPKWCETLGLEEAIHSHQFRKTLAMFVIYQDPRNLGVIKRLFSHKSLAMTLAYVVNLPGMAKEIKLALIRENGELLAEILEAIDKDIIGGKAGLRIRDTIQKSPKYRVRLHDDGWETVEQYIENLLEEGATILHRTSLAAICTNTPCAVLHIGPDICTCDIVDCDWPVFTEQSIPLLKDDIKFHWDLIQNKYHSDDQRHYSLKHMENCLKRLRELEGDTTVEEEFAEIIKALAA